MKEIRLEVDWEKKRTPGIAGEEAGKLGRQGLKKGDDSLYDRGNNKIDAREKARG